MDSFHSLKGVASSKGASNAVDMWKVGDFKFVQNIGPVLTIVPLEMKFFDY